MRQIGLLRFESLLVFLPVVLANVLKRDDVLVPLPLLINCLLQFHNLLFVLLEVDQVILGANQVVIFSASSDF